MEIFKEIHLYTVLVQRISTIFIDQMQTHIFPRKSTFYVGIRTFNSSSYSLIIPKEKKAQFKVSLGKYLLINTHSIYSVDECFMC